jgi:hypothetical protein
MRPSIVDWLPPVPPASHRPCKALHQTRSPTKNTMEAAACEYAVCLTQAQVVMFGISLVLGWLGTVIFSVTLVNERLDKAQMGISHAFEVGEIRLQHSIERLNEMYSK